MITPRVIAALIPRFELLRRAGSGAVGVTFRVRASGEVESVTVTRRYPAGFVNDACVRVISRTKFSPIAAKVIKEQGHPYVDVSTEIGVN
jgi:TonB family protein